jgi:hypothetical protein
LPFDPLNADPRFVAEITATYEESAARLKAIVLHPPGSSDRARQFNQARAATQLLQAQQEIDRLKRQASAWTGRAMTSALDRGIATADQQLRDAGVHKSQGGGGIGGGFHQVNHEAVRLFAQDTLRDTVGDLYKAADQMGKVAGQALRKMAVSGVTSGDVNRILAGHAVIEGQPQAAVRELKDLLTKVYGKTVEVPTVSGGFRTYDTGYYARMVATTKTREAVVKANHGRLLQRGVTLVKIIGRTSVNFCTQYLGHIYSIEGRDAKYPPLASLPSGGPPFHPFCSKSTAPYIEGLSAAPSQSAESEAA